MGKDLRAIACNEAKRIAKEKGGTPAQHMKEGWKIARGESTRDNAGKLSVTFFSVYHESNNQVKKRGRSIVPAESEEKARKMFYDPDDPVGSDLIVQKITKARKIPKGWGVNFKNGKGIAQSSVLEDVLLDGEDKIIKVRFKNGIKTLKLSEIMVANAPQEKRILRKA